ncbi:MAG: helix-turn-helix transcriptional regulator [Actinomycetota bacterium]|nr:helix-turn-helix transcriptional regulator [Actinomycetota bacterium]
MTAGQLIRQARLIAGLTQQQLGERVGKAAPHIARWERDAVDPGFETVRTLLRACGVDLSMELVAYDVSGDAELEHNLRLTAAERLDQAEAELRRLARSPERAASLGFDASELKWFRPVELFAILDKSGLEYVTIGAFGALLHGSGVLSDNIDIVPSTRPANLERLRQAYIALNARTPKSKQLRLDSDEAPKALTRMLTRSGPLNIILSPAGTSGYDDLRRKAIWRFVFSCSRWPSLTRRATMESEDSSSAAQGRFTRDSRGVQAPCDVGGATPPAREPSDSGAGSDRGHRCDRHGPCLCIRA